jgi:hypothetical protein
MSGSRVSDQQRKIRALAGGLSQKLAIHGCEGEGLVVQVRVAIHENCPITPTTLNNVVVDAI